MKKLILITLACLLALPTLWFIYDTHRNSPERNTLNTYSPALDLDWNNLNQTKGEWQITVINTGIMDAELGKIINLESKKAIDLGLENITTKIDIPVALLQHPVHGNILIDTGLDSSHQDNPYGTFGGLLAPSIMGPKYQKSGIKELVDELQIKIDLVLLTHLHPDHTAGLLDLPGSVKVAFGQKEKLIHYPFLFETRHFEHIKSAYEINFDMGTSVAPFEKVVDIFNDSSLFAVSAAGHTQGSILFLAHTHKGLVLFTGDTLNVQENLDYKIGAGDFSNSKEEAETAAKSIFTFIDTYPDTKLLLGHRMPAF